MRDRKELIDILECCHEDDCGHCPAYLTDGRQCDGATELSIPVPVFIFDDVLKLLKEQEPSKLTISENAYGVKFYYCPRCERPILKSAAYGHPRYCEDCGKELIWE